jgi:hypothetical protein
MKQAREKPEQQSRLCVPLHTGQSGARDLKQQRTRAAIVRNTTTRKGTERRDRMERCWGQQELPLLPCVPPIAGSAAKREIWSSRASKSWARARRREPAWASSGAAAWSGAADSESPNPGLAQQHAVPRRCARLNHSVINDSSCYNALRCAPTRCALVRCAPTRYALVRSTYTVQPQLEQKNPNPNNHTLLLTVVIIDSN